MKIDSFTKISDSEIPRLPLEGDIDLTYRCNCNCRHCWLRLPASAPAKKKELSLDEIIRIVCDARAIGCRRWSISGGEPMLRPDFVEIFDRITRDSLPYALNTNGTLLTPAIARLLRRKGVKMVALYGATEQIHDHITRTPGSFAAAMQGMAYLREAGAGFIVQLIPMRDNHDEFDAMIRLARSLSPVWRVGAPWLYFSAGRSAARNREIAGQRLDPAAVIQLDPPDIIDDDETVSVAAGDDNPPAGISAEATGRIFAACIEGCKDFNIDPYGRMSFCSFIKDPALRYNLRTGSFQEAWENFIPSIADQVLVGAKYQKNCGCCARRRDCRWCPAYAYLEHGRYSAKVSYLCDLANEAFSYKEDWRLHHRRYFRIAGITIRVDSDVPFTEKTHDRKFNRFKTDGPGEEMILLRHHFFLPEFDWDHPGEMVYHRAPWAIYRKERSWIYLDIGPRPADKFIHRMAVFNDGHTRGRIYHGSEEPFREGNLHSLTLLPSDQILLVRALADRQALFLHAAGVILNGKGILLVGHSGAGKTTAARMLQAQGDVLCDDRIIVRRWPKGFRIHGTWSHGDLADVSAADAPLSAILFLEKADTNGLVPVMKPREAGQLLAQHVVRSLVTADWWEKILALIEHMAQEVSAYRLEFDKSGGMRGLIAKIL